MKLIVYVLSNTLHTEIKKLIIGTYDIYTNPSQSTSITLTTKRSINETDTKVTEIVSIKISDNKRDGIFSYMLQRESKSNNITPLIKSYQKKNK
jgi:hypothetical protein